MRIGVVGSMNFTEQLIALKDELNALGHDAFLTNLHDEFVGKSEAEKEEIKQRQKLEDDAIREFWRVMQGADAILVANYDKHGIKNYIGGNTLLEIGFAHVLNQQIFLLNDIPDISYYRSEIEAMRPVILHGDLTKIPAPQLVSA